jgi:creatinine amidohydrolase
MAGAGHLSTMTWDTVPDAALVLVPVGSTEQHGPHLPFSTDTVIAQAAADRIADALADRGVPVLVAPSIGYGASGEHQGFPGTMSVGHEALRHLVVELVRSLSTWARRIVFVNGHGGNVGTIVSALTQMRSEQHDVAWLACAFESATDAHAGATETSVMLHLAPHLVDMAKAVPGQLAPLDELMPVLMSSGVRAAAPTGVLGDPSEASAEAGAQLMAQLVADGTDLVVRGVTDDRARLVLAAGEAA